MPRRKQRTDQEVNAILYEFMVLSKRMGYQGKDAPTQAERQRFKYLKKERAEILRAERELPRAARTVGGGHPGTGKRR